VELLHPPLVRVHREHLEEHGRTEARERVPRDRFPPSQRRKGALYILGGPFDGVGSLDSVVRESASLAVKVLVPAPDALDEASERVYLHVGEFGKRVEPRVELIRDVCVEGAVGAEGGRDKRFETALFDGLVVFKRVGGVVRGAQGGDVEFSDQPADRKLLLLEHL